MERQTQDNLANELLTMAQADQDMRRGLDDGGEWDPEIDKRNTKRMRELIDRYGWPKISDVGEEAASAAWILVQHADLEPDFQVACLELIHNLPEGEISPSDQAYLEDRVLVNTGRPQLYGSQFTGEGGPVRPQPIDDVEYLDERRASVGLPPFAEYEKLMHELFRKQREAKRE